jgi:hypothetical protein
METLIIGCQPCSTNLATKFCHEETWFKITEESIKTVILTVLPSVSLKTTCLSLYEADFTDFSVKTSTPSEIKKKAIKV